MYILRYIYSIILLIFTLLLRLYLFILKRTAARTQEKYDRHVYKITNWWASYMLKVLGIKVKLKGKENLPEGNCMFVSNHQGNADFFIPMAVLNKQLGFIAKKEILKIPILRTWMKDMHCVFIDRENIRESLKAINQGIDNVNAGYSMLIFPEGTRSKSHKLGEFKKGSMKMALKANAPLVPIVLDNTFKVFEENKGKLKPATITMSILKPIDVNALDKEQKAHLAELVREKIAQELEKNQDN
ncbi:1-acyl-sn-glycerol-3-phosphate acyltransferase [Clostridium sp. 19966]|nr:1-acyl-sn-glycerol-3-phosphate acyltransferase [Clostridium sp. 19966]